MISSLDFVNKITLHRNKPDPNGRHYSLVLPQPELNLQTCEQYWNSDQSWVDGWTKGWILMLPITSFSQLYSEQDICKNVVLITW